MSATVHVGIDPGRRSGIASISDGKLMFVGSLDPSNRVRRDKAIADALGGFPALEASYAIEGWSGGPLRVAGGIPVSSVTLIGFGESIGQWFDSLAWLGVDAATVRRPMASQWRSVLPFRGRGRDEWKKIACDYVRHRFGLQTRADEAEAVCMALWLESEERQQEMIYRARGKR